MCYLLQHPYSRAVLLMLMLLCRISDACAQDTAILSAYLRQHRYAVDLSAQSPFPMLPAMMAKHNVLLVGECNHELRLFDTLQPAITRQLRQQKLKYVIVEFGRAQAAIANSYLSGHSPYKARIEKSRVAQRYREFAGNADFKVIGADFERTDLYFAVSKVLRGFDTASGLRTKTFLHTLVDSGAYFQLNEKRFSRFYKSISRDFEAQDGALREELGDRYEPLRYLCTNPNTTTRYENRNMALAQNILQELTPLDTVATYLGEFGGYHTRLSDKHSLAATLSREAVLKDRLLVMNTHCVECRTDEGSEFGGVLRFIKGVILRCFQNAALSDVTLFDLSALPEAFEQIKADGTLLLFVQHHN